MWDWFKMNWLGLVQTAGVLGAAYGLCLTVNQLATATAQLDQAKEALRANTIFAVQKDGRDLIGSIAADGKVFRLIFDLDKGAGADDETRLRATIRVGQLINYYASMYNQFKTGAIDQRFWKTGLAELCVVLKTPFGASMWRQINKEPEGYQSGFLAEGNTCRQ